ncbi:MAG TPA: bifunctional tetrahydrofolate synthase/dihydrofolate synthase [Burkholderiales bacterium]|nr:bifunctional tetrahydrofolate synthase/dihydrofolate synthase [Burkholderiales bacterium]
METLNDWLAYIERVNPRAIEMGLERVAKVQRALALKPAFPIFTVGGTNGKGSACAMLEAILGEGGYRVGCYTSPHLLRYNERVRIGRREASDADLVRALAVVEAARQDTPLTYFEFSTLAAMWLFEQQRIEVAVLEVGLGGRLDAVNAFDTDCALVMSVALDHMDYLGATREEIGREKAGILRPGRPAVCADAEPPQSLLEHAATTGAQLLLIGRDFGYEAAREQWRYWGPRSERHGLPHPALRGDYQLANAAACLAALDALHARVPVSAGDIRTGLVTVENPGRFQVLPGRPVVVLDVAHNPAAAAALSQNLARMPCAGRTYAVFAMLGDKDIRGVVEALKPHIDEWFVSGIEAARGTSATSISEELARAGVREGVSTYGNVAAAYTQACDMAAQNDRIVVFGSFHTVAAVMALRVPWQDR